MPTISGRKEEQEIMQKLLKEDKAHFLAVYGRRRIGKTFLIKQVYAENIVFHMTGLSNAKTIQQLANFHTEIKRINSNVDDQQIPGNWMEAFERLRNYLKTIKKRNKKVVFLDELPWMDTRQSDFLPALEHFWNSWASNQPDILLVVCGSAASWMINKLINNKGGLHNRVTKRIRLQPFTLGETEEFFRAKKINPERYDIIQLYMAMGGIPFYLDEIEAGKSAFQEIERLCFKKSGLLYGEYDNLYKSLFKSPERHMIIIETLSKKSKGLTREELIKKSGIPGGGNITKTLLELEESGFINRVYPFDKKIKDTLYRLTDQFSLFYHKFMKDNRAGGKNSWLTRIDSPAWKTWSGYAYENICLVHTDQIKKALGISGVYSEVSSWYSTKPGVQIDMLLDRRDNVISLCEIKFSIKPFVLTAAYRKELQNKVWAFQEKTQTSKSVFLTLITTFGLQNDQHEMGLIQNTINMNDLFSKGSYGL